MTTDYELDLLTGKILCVIWQTIQVRAKIRPKPFRVVQISTSIDTRHFSQRRSAIYSRLLASMINALAIFGLVLDCSSVLKTSFHPIS